jgi:hypothetical protein
MSKIALNEPKHWHDDRGHHRMPDPRQFTGYAKRFWDADERAYVAHLETHEAEGLVPKPLPDDTDEIKTLFRMIGLAEETIRVSRELIRAKRLSRVDGMT